MNPFSQPFTPDTDAKRKGKIAHLPRPFREKTNQLLYGGQTAVQIAKWLNEIPEIKAILANHFGGRPISPQNLSEWKQGGYREWLRHQQLLQQTGELAANAGDLARAADGLADSLFGLLTLDYTQTLMNREAQTPAEFEKRRKALSLLTQDIVRLRRCDLNARRVEIQEERFDQTREKTSEQLFQKFVQWAGLPAIRKAFLLGPMERLRQLRQRFGLPPRPHDEALSQLTENDHHFKASGKNQTKFKPDQTKKTKSSSSTRRSRGDEALNSSSQNPAAETSDSDENAKRPDASPSPGGEGRGEGGLKLKTQPSKLPDSPNPSDLPPPKITTQLIAEIEEYSNLVSARKRASYAASKPATASEPLSPPQAPTENPAGVQSFSPGLERLGAPECNEGGRDYPGLEPQLDQGSMPEASRSPDSSGRAHLPLPPKSQPPLSDYDQARLEGKSHLEALYSQFTPTPEELERRKRENEALRSGYATDPSDPQPPAINPLQYYGPCPSPLGWHGLRYLDTSKVQTG